MKTYKILLAVMVLFSVKSFAQQEIVVNSTERYATNNVSVWVNTAVNSQVDTKTNADTERTKTFSKTFSVDQNDKVNFDNQYGSITIKTWDRKEVKVDVEIKAYSNSANDVQKLIDAVSIDAAKTGDAVSVKTNMAERNGRFGRGIKNGVTTWRREVKVIYVVYMPAVNPLTASQEYGNIEIGNYAGPTSFKVAYGNLVAGNLSNTNNYISVQYGKCDIQELNAAVVKHEYNGPVNIGTVGTLDLKAEYVGVSIGTIKRSADIKIEYGKGLTVGAIAGNLLLSAEYAKVNIASVKGNTVIKQSYGDLSIGAAGKLGVTAEYSNVTLGTLNSDANIRMSYNKLLVNEVTPACKNFNIVGEYTTVGLSFSPRYSGSFNVLTSYADFKYGSNVSANLVSKNDDSKKYTGKIGGSGANTVNVKTEYAAVTFK